MSLHVCPLNARHCDRESLKLSTRQLRYLAIENVVQFKVVAHLLLVVKFKLGIQHLVYRHVTLDRAWYVIDILGFNQCLDVILQDFGEIILKFGSAEVF